jgi:anti-sigma regulatory factor (Ser/Thr protein kinase)
MLQFTLEDDGEQVDLDTIRPRELDDVRPGGLGIHLIREVMGEAIWEHLPEGGTRLTMRAVPASTAQDHREETTHYAW